MNKLLEKERIKRQIERKQGKIKIDFKIPIIILCSAVGLAVITIIILLNTIAYTKIFNGISVNGVALGGKTVVQAQEILRARYEGILDNEEVVLKAEDKSINITSENIEAEFNYKEAANAAFNEGRQGNVFKKIGSALALRMGKKNIVHDITYNKIKLDEKIEDLTEKFGEAVEQPSYEINYDTITIKNGKTGKGVDFAKVEAEVLAAFRNLENKKEIFAEISTVTPNITDINEIRGKVKTEPQNAQKSEQDGKINLVEHTIGRDFDVNLARNELAKHSSEGDSFTIPLIITMPEITIEDITGDLFKETISSFTTKYKTSEISRSENIRLATQFINDTILLPGEEFSYNERVGERSADRGFKIAKVFSDGEVVDGMGGGICQLSSTLYNAVLLADMEVTSRRNHSLTVSYVKSGTDATVAFGSIDFKFKNNRDVPIKISAKAENGNLETKILGINKEKDKTVEISTVVISTTAPEEKIEIDETMEPGTNEVVKKGQSGMKVETYKTIKKAGEVVSKTKISTDVYRKTDKVVKQGPVLETTIEGQPIAETPKEVVVPEKLKKEEDKTDKNNNKGNKKDNIKIDNDLLIDATL